MPESKEQKVQKSRRRGPDSDLYDIPPEMADLAEGYLERRLAVAEELRAAVADADFETTRRLGHNMKGSGGGYGFARISELGAEIQRASEGGDADAIESLAGELSEYAQKALASLAAEPPPSS